MKKKMVECASVPVRVIEETARYLDDITKELPKSDQYKYRRKGSVSVATEVNTTERTDVSKITTKQMDRDNEIVLPDGIELEQYRLNPIVLFGHDQDRPIGKALWIKPTADDVLAKTLYASRPEQYQGEWLPDFVFSMVQADVLRGKSIGFLPLDVRDPTEEELAINRELQYVITKSILLEFSVVSVPSNPTALVEAVGKGIGLEYYQFKKIGTVKKKVKAEPKPKQKLYTPMAGKVDLIHLDPAHIADLAIKRLAARWEV